VRENLVEASVSRLQYRQGRLNSVEKLLFGVLISPVVYPCGTERDFQDLA
jgi:hypothetical protein